MLAERGIEVDHVTVYRWVQRFTPLLIDAARPCRHRVGDRWQVDETYVKVAGQWRYVYRAIDQFGQVIDVYVGRVPWSGGNEGVVVNLSDDAGAGRQLATSSAVALLTSLGLAASSPVATSLAIEPSDR